MKLTKGKIAKLYNKRKQTLKKKSKPKRSAGKSKTFRQNRKVNLSRQSLRRFSYSGGRLPVNVSNRVLSVADTGLSTAQQGLSNVDQVVSMVPPVGPVGEAKLGLTAAEMGISGIQTGVEAAQGAVNPTDELPEPMDGSELPAVGTEPTVDSELPEPVSPIAEPAAPIVVNTEPSEPAINAEVANAPDMPSSEEQNGKLNDAVKTIVDEITKQVEENLTTRVTPGDVAPNVETNSNGEANGNGEVNGNGETNGNVEAAGEAAPGGNVELGNVETNGQDDGFKALTGAVDKLTSDAVAPESGGKRRRNTRRFKLVKNKTKRAIKQMANTL
jgi:hypothetical protein